MVVTRELNRNGHVDLTFKFPLNTPARVSLGEAKIYDGPEYHVKGLEQLINRYTTGRESRCVILAYVKKANVKGLMEKVREHFEEKRPCGQSTAGKPLLHQGSWFKHRQRSQIFADP